MSTLWTYWEGDRPPIISLCLETLQRFHPDELRVVSPHDLAELRGEKIPHETEGLPACIRSDLVRLAVLFEFGGLWIDADFICLSRIDLLDQVEELDLLGVHNPHQTKGWGAAGNLRALLAPDLVARSFFKPSSVAAS